MQKKTCPNGHVYDQSIYGDTCPLCPSSATSNMNPVSNPTVAVPNESPAPHTRVIQPTAAQANMAGGYGGGAPQMQHAADPTGSTRVAQAMGAQRAQNAQQAPTHAAPRTTIRRNPAMMGGAARPDEGGRKLVGFLVTYNRTPLGKAFNIYEGRNYIGRDADCDVAISDDNQMSGKHLLIRYLSGNNKFSFKDEMSSNGTYVNKQLLDEGELHNYDIIRVGSTLFIFIAIPQI